MASASDDKTIRLWHSHDGTPAASPLHGHTGRVNCVTFTPDGTRLVSGSDDYTVRVWRVSDGSAVTGPFQGHTRDVSSVAVSGDGTLVASGSYDRTVRVWRLDDGTPAARPLAGHTHWIQSVAYAPDGTRVISGSEDGTMRAWNVREGLVPAASELPPLSFPEPLCFSSDGAHVVTESDDNGIQMWSVADGTCQPASVDMRPLSPPSKNSSPDGLYTAETNKHGNLVQVISAADGTTVAGPFDSMPLDWLFSNDSASVIIGFHGGSIEVVDLASGQTSLNLRYAYHEIEEETNEIYMMIAECPTRSLLASLDAPFDGNDYLSQTLRIWRTSEPSISLELPAISSLTPAQPNTLLRIYDQCDLREDGWLIDNDDNLLLWLPPDLVDLEFSLFLSLVVTESGILQVPKQKLLVGEQWDKCYIKG
ncbi:hypothetical protein RSOLAG1IB_12479 [Rhizoctonia solani AG-1 IB]|uniref:Uncharacterized protein n=1 Tax=Thanatephorus cucumeris (strain AG1-IB / isolate 7/3/14) TaxID=1108050 RepID=A0A0B7FUC2_THACB|nr:hypothetical protein RSOLAG1IB_12479 [Rhizoctonia solani AG-1 IB]